MLSFLRNTFIPKHNILMYCMSLSFHYCCIC